LLVYKRKAHSVQISFCFHITDRGSEAPVWTAQAAALYSSPMFFTASKIIWGILSPLNLVFLVLLCGAVMSIFSKALGRSLMALGLFLFVAFGIFPLGQNMLAFLEKQHERPAAMPERVHGIVVLGGSFMTHISEVRGVTAINETGERIIDGLTLAKRYPDAILVFSGGNGRLLGGDRTEAEDAELFLRETGLTAENVLYEDQSRNTWENIKFTRNLLMPQPDETWILVTSAYHMPRAMRVAKALGWTMIPYPTDYRTPGYGGWLPRDFDMLGNFYDLHVAMHEYIGLAAYQLSKKISLR